MLKRRVFISGLLTALVFTFTSCQIESTSSPPPLRTYEESVQKVNFTGNTATINFQNLYQHNIYLVKINTSGFVVPAAGTGRVPNTPLQAIGHPSAQAFSANPPPIADRVGGIDLDRSAIGRQAFVPPQVGEQRSFWVEDVFDSGRFVNQQATLRATGRYGNIWVMNNTQSVVLDTQARALAEKFDAIYPLTTNLFGFEYGGGPGGNGGMDGDPKIQILVYDILDGRGEPAAGGYFWAKDFYTQFGLNYYGMNIRTNKAEIFYLETSSVIGATDYAYSTLIHELQHMINFNVKSVEQGKASETWYNEMLSLLAEDVIAPLIGIGPEHRYGVINSFIPVFLGNYNRVGITEWDVSESILFPYANVLSFGAYLIRNFGGPALLRSISLNNTTGIDSLSAALQISSSVSFNQALERFGEAMIFSGRSIPVGALTLDRTVSSTVNGVNYTAYGFDIWSMYQRPGSGRGPRIHNLNPAVVRPHSIMMQSSFNWTNVSGNLSITMERPVNESIEIFLMVR